MESFFKFWDRINTEAKDKESPQYNIPTMDIDGGYELKTLTPEDMSQATEDDVNAWRAKYGTNTTKIGDQMTDEELRKFFGQS